MYRRLSEVSGVHIVAATGFDSQETSIPTHFRLIGFFYRGQGPLQWKRAIPGHFAPSHSGSREYFMFLFYNELTEGMAAPCMIRSYAKAGLVRTGAGRDGLTQAEELAIRGAAMAARKAGLAVFTGQWAPEQLALLRAEGLAPERIVVGHCDDARAVDPERDRRLAGEGAYVAYDHIGWESDAAHALSDEERAVQVKALVDAGLAERVVLSCSAIGAGLGRPASPHGFAHLLSDFIPRLRKAGVAEEAIETMLVANPKRILSGAMPQGV
jgi:phosphotriesterase-related protein